MSLFTLLRGKSAKTSLTPKPPTAPKIALPAVPITLSDPTASTPETYEYGQPPAALRLRPRFAKGEPDRMTKLQDEADYLSSDVTHGRGGTIISKPPRWKSALLGMLSGAGQAANRALASGQTDWGGVAQAIGGGIGGGVATGADPGIVVRARHDQAIAENQADIDRHTQNTSNQAQLDYLKARSEGERADAAYKTSLPKIKLQERADQLKQQEIENHLAQAKFELEEKVKNGEITWKEAQVAIDKLNAQAQLMNAQSNRLRTTNTIATEGGKATNKRDANIRLSQTYYKKAESYDAEATRLEGTLSKIPQDTYEGQQETERRKKQIDTLRGEARHLREDGDKARGVGESEFVSPTPAPTKGAKPKSDPLGLF